MKRIFEIFVIFLFLNSYLYSQEYNPEELEELTESNSRSSSSLPDVDLIEQYMANPLNLRKTSVFELAKIPGFTISMSRKIIRMAKRNENITTGMIADSLNLNREKRYLLNECTYIEARLKNPERLNVRLRNEQRFNRVDGFERDKFSGSSLDLYQRYSASYRDYSMNLILNKNQGEPHLIEFYSGNISSNLLGVDFTAGDFYPESGMGSVLWKTFGMNKGSDVITPAFQYSSDIYPNRSVIDFAFFRGAALKKTYDLGKTNELKTALWAAYTPKPATIDTSKGEATSIYFTGLYRTETEIRKKNALLEKSAGGILEWKSQYFLVGLTALGLEYDKRITSESVSAFNGKSGLLSSLYFILPMEGKTAGLEISRDADGNLGLQAGAQFESSKYAAALHLRSFSPEYRSPYGYSFCESSPPSNITGLYGGIQVKPVNYFRWSLYFDLWKTGSGTYYSNLPEKGTDVFTEAKYYYKRETHIYFRLTWTDKTKTAMIDSLRRRFNFTESSKGARLEIYRFFGDYLKLRFRTEISYTGFENLFESQFGLLSFLEYNWKFLENSSVGTRITYFSTPGYESAIWQYESYLPGNLSTSPLYGSGWKAVVFMNYNPYEFLSLWAKFSYMVKYNVSSLGSGYDRIPGNEDKRLVLQLDLNL